MWGDYTIKLITRQWHEHSAQPGVVLIPLTTETDMLAPAQEQIPMNRTQRRAAEKAAKRKPPAATKRFASQKEAYAHLLKPLALLNDCRPFREGEVDLDIVKVRFAYDRLKDGTADEDDFLLVGLAINMAKVRAMEISEYLADEIEKAQDAMNRCRERYLKHGRFGFDGIGIQAMDYAIEAHDEIVQKSSPKQMQMAAEVVRKVLLKQMGGKQLPALKV